MADQLVFGHNEIHTGYCGVIIGGETKRLKDVKSMPQSVSSEPLKWEKWSTLEPLGGFTNHE